MRNMGREAAHHKTASEMRWAGGECWGPLDH